VFEEATGRSPSVAESLLKRRIPQPHYVDIDPTPEERRILGISEHSSGGAAIAPASSPDVYEYVTLDDQIKRETEWLRRISATKFEKALIICGLSHSLSIAFKLRSAGIAVREVYTYIPYSLLCPMRH
jgi:hypothetical protein